MKLQNSTLQMNRFQDMALSPVLLAALTKMKIIKPTEIQARAIPEALNGRDLIAVAQTGSGKTLAFALPIASALGQKPQTRALVLVPSREMAQQIFKVFTELCAEFPVSTCLVMGGVPSAKQIKALKKNPRLIIGTPGRLNDHLIGDKSLLSGIEYVVIDEADRMLDLGFAPQLKNIKSHLDSRCQTLMFSASFSSTVEAIAKLFLNSHALRIRSSQAEEPVASLKQRILFIDKFKKNDRLLDELNATQGGVIVFCGNQGSCERTGQYLEEYGFSVDLIHGGLSQGQRNRVVRQFREGQIRILVATDLLARGIDVPHVDHVINFDLPHQVEDFLHRIGRTARAGRSGNAITFVTSMDGKMFQKIKPYLQGASEQKLETGFAFMEKALDQKLDSARRNKPSPKRTFDGSKKPAAKPRSQTIGRSDRPAQLSRVKSQTKKAQF